MGLPGTRSAEPATGPFMTQPSSRAGGPSYALTCASSRRGYVPLTDPQPKHPLSPPFWCPAVPTHAVYNVP